MIAASRWIPKSAWLRAAQAGAIVLALLVVITFLRHSLLTQADSFRLDFERQSFIELSRGETFLVARKLAALAKGEQINCVSAKKKGVVFFEEQKARCGASFFRSVQTVKEPNQEIEVTFTIRLQDELFHGFLIFLALQAILALATFFAQRQAIFAEHERDILLAGLARQVGHDIRSPLAVLSHFHSRGEADPSVALRAIGRLKDLVSHLLGEAPHSTRANLGQLVSQAAQEKTLEFSGQAEIRFFVEDAVEKIAPPGEAFLWRRLLSNLLNNSIEASAKPAVVEVQAKAEASGWSLRVRDRGRGMEPEVLAKAGRQGFTHGKPGGSGLGLSSAREFVERWGGQLKLESQPGKGTTVTIEFAKKEAAILVDDDTQLGALWAKVAARAGLEFRYFASPSDFLREAGNIPPTTAIYLDVSFAGDAEAGLKLGAELHTRGFKRIFLATGHPKERFAGLPWLAGVVGKEPPWVD
jgi:signal transduction histidine kinase